MRHENENAGPLKDKVVLIVDDSPVIRNIIKATLQPMGLARIIEAEDGEKAFEALCQGKVDLVVADWKMPKVSGLELLEKIRKSEALSHTSFILISSVPEREMITKSISLSVNSVMVKPLDTRALKNTVVKALGG